MQVLAEDLVRAQLARRVAVGRDRQRAARLVAALRAHRRAEEAAARARRLLALSVNS